MLKRTSNQLSLFSSLEDMLNHNHPLYKLDNKITGVDLKTPSLVCIVVQMVALPILFV